jgi:hypothetical protein
MISKRAIVAVPILLFFIASCGYLLTPYARFGESAKARLAANPIDAEQNAECQPNTIKEFTFQGGTFKDGKLIVAPEVKVEPGPAKNMLMLRRPNGATTFSCFCVLEGGDCWAVSQPVPEGVALGCASVNCASGEEPFCFSEILDDVNGFNFRLAVATKAMK